MNEKGRLPHWRELIIQSHNFDLIIRPHGGIKNGWELNFNEDTAHTDDVEINDNYTLVNKARNEGILYNIMFQLKH